MTNATDHTAPYLAQFEAARDRLPGAATPWLAALRQDAIDRFAASGFPSRRNEDWKYTNLTRLERAAFAAASGAAIDRSSIEPHFLTGIAGPRLVFVDGIYAADLSDIGGLGAGITLTTLGESDAALLEGRLGSVATLNGNGLAALNTAMMADGVVLRLERNAVLAEPVQIVHVATTPDIAVHPRNLIVAEETSQATIVELFVGAGAGRYWTNAVTEIEIGDGAHVHHVRLQQEDNEAFHIGLAHIRLGRDSRYNGVVLSTGAALARTELKVAMAGEGAEFNLTGGAFLDGKRHADITTEIDHLVPHGQSNQLIKNVLDDQARSVFQGRVIVQQDAQKTNAHQTNRNLLLSPRAQADTKPELRIHADDVKCSHGATVGDLDADAMFYLTSRGIEADAARRLLIEAFIAEVLDGVQGDALRAACRSRLVGWLGSETMSLEEAA